MKSILGRPTIAAGSALLLAASACGSYPTPNAKVASSEAAIRAAEESGAEAVPQAALHLKLAQEQLASAKKLIAADDDNNERAAYVLARAQSDAELAIALSHTKESQEEAGKALDEVRSIQNGQTPSTN